VQHGVEGTDELAVVLHELEVLEGHVSDLADTVVDDLLFFIASSSSEGLSRGRRIA
jgi:hypothetical protein